MFLWISLLQIPIQAISQDSKQDYHPYELIIKFDNRRTHINGDFTAIYGIITGLSIHHSTRIKLGINSTGFHAGRKDGGKQRNSVSRMFYYSIGGEYDLIDLPKITIIPFLKVGLGRHYYQVYDQDQVKLEDFSEKILPLEVGIYLSDHLNPWLDLKVGGGWRWVLLNSGDRLGNYFLKVGLGLHLKKLRIHRNK